MSTEQDNTVSPPAAPVPSGTVAGPQLPPLQPAAAKRSWKSKDKVAAKSFASGPSSSGLPQILNGMQNFHFSDRKQLTINTYTPNSFGLFAVLHMLCTSMIGHDRFLKSVRLWHPLTVYLFYSVVFYIHLLRVHRASGLIDAYHLTMLQALETMFPFDNIIIPGPLVPYFMSLSVSAAPYEWFADVIPRLPNLSRLNADNSWTFDKADQNSMDQSNFPNPLLFVDAIYRFAKGRLVRGTVANNAAVITPSDLVGIGQPVPANAILAHDGDMAPFPFAYLSAIHTDRSTIAHHGNIANVAIANNDERRFFFNDMSAKLPLPESKRVNDQFFTAISEQVGYYNVELQAAEAGPPPVAAVNMTIMQSQLNQFAFDLPARPTHDNDNADALLLEHLLCFTDVPGVNNRTLKIRTWFAQLIPDMTMFCRFIEDSRPLTSINLIGLGCAHIKWTLLPNPQLYLQQPIDDNQEAETFNARRARITVTNFAARGDTADPTLETVAERISAISMNNIVWTQIADVPAVADQNQRTGPYWVQPDMSQSSVFDLGPYLGAEIGRYVRPVAL